MKEAQFISILAHPRLDRCAELATNQSKQLAITYSLQGPNATSFCKDLASDFSTWQINHPEQLHRKILDLLAFVRQKNLELEFALSLLCETQIIFAAYSGEVILKRNGQSKKILSSSTEIKVVTGTFKNSDQIILSNQSGNLLTTEIEKMLINNISLEKIVSDISLMQEEHQDLNTSLAFLTYQEKVVEPKPKTTFHYQKIFTLLKKTSKIPQKIWLLSQKIYSWFKKQNKKKLLIAVGAFLLLIIGSFGISQIIGHQQKQVVNNISQQITAIKQSTQDIDQLLLQQPLTAREKAQSSLQAMIDLKKEKNNKESLKLINAEIDQLEQLIQKISGDNSLDRLSIAFNLENFLGQKLVVADDQIFVLENNGQEILQINSDQTNHKFSLEDGENIRDFTMSENKLFVLSSGIKMLDLSQNETEFTEIKAEGESDKNGEFLSSFGPYLYLLNKDKRNIYRYYYNDGELSDPIGWLVDKQGVNFEQISDLMVDGDLWIGNKSGNLLRFSKGSAVDFQITGLSQLPDSPILIGANENSELLAVLEKQNKRLLILTKDGQLISEIKSNELAGANSIALNHDGTKVYVLSGSIIYEVNPSLNP